MQCFLRLVAYKANKDKLNNIETPNQTWDLYTPEAAFSDLFTRQLELLTINMSLNHFTF